MNQTYIAVFFFSLIFLFGATIEDRCSKFSGDGYNTSYAYNLTECPSSEKFNLLECYDAKLKNVLFYYQNIKTCIKKCGVLRSFHWTEGCLSA